MRAENVRADKCTFNEHFAQIHVRSSPPGNEARSNIYSTLHTRLFIDHVMNFRKTILVYDDTVHFLKYYNSIHCTILPNASIDLVFH